MVRDTRPADERALYRGGPCETTLSVAWSNSGELQLELIQQLDDTPSIFTEFLAADGPDYQQLAYWTSDFEGTMREVEKAGWTVVWSGGEGFGVRFAYIESPDAPAAVIEISELTEATEANARQHARCRGELGRQRPDPGARRGSRLCVTATRVTRTSPP